MNQTLDDGFDSAPENPSSPNVLQIKWKNSYANVCYDGWSSTDADLICERFGFSHSKRYSSIEMDLSTTNSSFVQINSGVVKADSILSNLNGTDSCPKNQIVALECITYGMDDFFSFTL